MEVMMNRLSKSLLAGSLALLAVGFFVSYAPMRLSPVWTIVLPYGVILFGLFLISVVFQNELTDTQRRKLTPQHRNAPKAEEEVPGTAARTPHRHAHA